MAYSFGANIVKTGLVFAYDTGDQTNSWIGAPTTNLVDPSWTNWSVDGSGQGSIGTRTIISPYYCQIVDLNANTRQNIYINGISANTTYTFSVQYRKLSGTPTLRFQIQAYNGGSYISTMTFATTAQLGITDTYDWQTAYITLTTPANTNRILWFMQDGNDYVAYTHAFELRNVQLQQGSYVSTFTPTSRSTTQGLLDISGNNNTVTLTNMTYGAGNTISFDGTSNYISVANSSLFKSNQITVELIIKFNAFQSADLVQFGVGSGTYAQWYFRDLGNGNFNWFHDVPSSSTYSDLTVSRSSLTTGKYYHIVCTAANSNSTAVYYNGVLAGTAGGTSYSIPATWTPAAMTIGGFSWDGYSNSVIPVCKVYNQALTLQQIQQNYNSYKTRFNLP